MKGRVGGDKRRAGEQREMKERGAWREQQRAEE